MNHIAKIGIHKFPNKIQDILDPKESRDPMSTSYNLIFSF